MSFGIVSCYKMHFGPFMRPQIFIRVGDVSTGPTKRLATASPTNKILILNTKYYPPRAARAWASRSLKDGAFAGSGVWKTFVISVVLIWVTSSITSFSVTPIRLAVDANPRVPDTILRSDFAILCSSVSCTGAGI
jgi:hypothetical protein